MIKVTVPATSANLGSGFDALGIALTLYNEATIELWDGIEIQSLDDTVIPKGPENLIYASAQTLYNVCGKTLKGLRIRQQSAIPMTRGLGSSSACIVAGLIGANHLLGLPLQKQDILNLAATMEGHPDNVAPAVLGGLVTSVMDGKSVHSISVPVSREVRFVAMIPDFEMRTDFSRGILPAMLSREDAVFNLSRTALMTAALFSGSLDALRVAVEDKIHQPYRMGHIPHGEEAMAMAYELGAYGVYLSGAGPCIMAIVDAKDKDFAPIIRDALAVQGVSGWNFQTFDCDPDGAQVSGAI